MCPTSREERADTLASKGTASKRTESDAIVSVPFTLYLIGRVVIHFVPKDQCLRLC